MKIPYICKYAGNPQNVALWLEIALRSRVMTTFRPSTATATMSVHQYSGMRVRRVASVTMAVHPATTVPT